jgi:hypothetical protein
MHLYLALPVCERAEQEVLGAPGVAGLKEISGGRDATLSQLLGLFTKRSCRAMSKPCSQKV